ncbi:alpha/beta fold hydrolase [Paracoccus caeni]|uniref:Alpha/beta fold hydrolase n=1 Tax=Paracoccus caeni TaxID=657651 RepID=A0A934SEQ5_9RHOB|nr:alpha/beta fold hydrolase [Paracoccus caeni]MBK4217521.1 alpha/beta fold hydrolase [Paracoccus caeni]
MFARQILIPTLLCLALAACSARPPIETLAPVAVQPPADAKLVQIYAATTRQRLADRPYAFGAGRAEGLSYAAFQISVPPGHQPGKIEWPDGPPDPQTDFVTLRQQIMSPAAFADALRGKDAGVFVHGYNHSFQEALFRTAQMGADSHLTASPILFSWPSEGSTAAYLADRDGVDYSRDALTDLLTELARQRSANGRVAILAHSMGARLTMEALRQLRLQGRDDVLARLDVVLAAPDIDIDTFREQARVIGPMQEPITVLVASDDKALAISARVSSGRQRVGSIDIRNPQIRRAMEHSGMRVIDISSIQPDQFAHDRYIDLISLYPQLEATQGATPGTGIRRAGAFIFDSVGMTFDSIGNVLAD